ncbi:hypothetical protein ADL00_26810 [Streptomyces sp. AS58]|nr:hypothetical protein ADL00_26810 [Streptomyces sp. AS58]
MLTLAMIRRVACRSRVSLALSATVPVCSDRVSSRASKTQIHIALDLLARMPMLALTGEIRRWEPRRHRLRLFSAVAQLVTTASRRHLRYARHGPWTDLNADALARLEALPNPG